MAKKEVKNNKDKTSFIKSFKAELKMYKFIYYVESLFKKTKIIYCFNAKNIATPALTHTLCGLSVGSSTNNI